jgi:GNAT superfamily N-acetyltransferase
MGGPVQVRTIDDPAEFLERARPFLLTDEARHNLMLGVVGRIVSDPSTYPSFRLWLVEDADGSIVGAASMTTPWPVALARPAHPDVVGALVAAARDDELPIPGVVGAVPEVHDFAARWAATTGERTVIHRSEGVYALDAVTPVAGASGRARPATEADRGVLEPWMEAFVAEAHLEESVKSDGGRELVDARLRALHAAGFWFWEDVGTPVSVAGYGGPTPNGIRIGPVYTPPPSRGRGYATALVAELSAWLLSEGRDFCFLNADLANPTSNAIYRRIGYRQVCESANVRFDPSGR